MDDLFGHSPSLLGSIPLDLRRDFIKFSGLLLLCSGLLICIYFLVFRNFHLILLMS